VNSKKNDSKTFPPGVDCPNFPHCPVNKCQRLIFLSEQVSYAKLRRHSDHIFIPNLVFNMKILSLFVFLFVCISINASWLSGETKKKGRDISEIPNPRTHPVECGRELVPHSSICDPDKILTTDIKDEIEGYLNAMKEMELAVVIINRMNVNDPAVKHISDMEQKAEVFARSLHDSWGIGDKETQKGVVLFLSIHDRVIYFSTGQGLTKQLDSDVLEALISGMRTYLKKGDYGTAIIHTVIEIDLLVTRKIKATYGGTGFTSKRDPTVSSSAKEGPWETFVSILFLSFFVAIGLFATCCQNRRIRNYERGQEQLNKLMKAVDDIKENKFSCTSCPICLEDFPVQVPPPAIPTATAEQQEQGDGIPQMSSSSEVNTAEKEATEVDRLLPSAPPLPDSNRSCEEEGASLMEDKDIPTATARLVDSVGNHDIEGDGSQKRKPSAPSISSVPAPIDADDPSLKHHPRKPMALNCGHVFCRSCLEEYLNKPDNNKCPICRADIDNGGGDGSQQGRTSTIPSATDRSPLRNRRSNLFPFQRSSNIRTLWNYYPSSSSTTGTGAAGSGATDTGLNPGSGSYTQTTYNHFSPELRYRLYRINHYYPDAFTAEALRSMNRAIDTGNFDELRNQVLTRSSELSRLVTEIREASRNNARKNGMSGSSSSSWGGGRSSGGRGGRW
jgi:uncharacterized membrane protein YgcG